MRTKKIGIVGDTGVRYGVKIKRKVRDTRIAATTAWRCPDCLKKTLQREAAGIWLCNKCGLKFAGKAYRPR